MPGRQILVTKCACSIKVRKKGIVTKIYYTIRQSEEFSMLVYPLQAHFINCLNWIAEQQTQLLSNKVKTQGPFIKTNILIHMFTSSWGHLKNKFLFPVSRFMFKVRMIFHWDVPAKWKGNRCVPASLAPGSRALMRSMELPKHRPPIYTTVFLFKFS